MERGFFEVDFCSMEMAGLKPLDALDVRLVHLLEKLPGIGGEAFDVTPLPLGIDGVEGQGTLAGTGDPGDHHQLVARNLDVDVLQVVLAGTFYNDLVNHVI